MEHSTWLIPLHWSHSTNHLMLFCSVKTMLHSFQILPMHSLNRWIQQYGGVTRIVPTVFQTSMTVMNFMETIPPTLFHLLKSFSMAPSIWYRLNLCWYKELVIVSLVLLLMREIYRVIGFCLEVASSKILSWQLTMTTVTTGSGLVRKLMMELK